MNTGGRTMKADGAVEDAGEVEKAAGGVTFEWLRQVRKWPDVTAWRLMRKIIWPLLLLI